MSLRRISAAGALVLALSIIALAPSRAGAFAGAEKDGYSVEAVGALRLTTAYLRFPDVPEFWTTQHDWQLAAVARLILDGDLGPVVSYDLNLFADLARLPSGLTSGSLDTAGSVSTPYRTTYLTWTYWEDCNESGNLGIDRLSFGFDLNPARIQVGRFPVNWSVSRIFTPNDFYAPFSATAVNKVYKPGVDALLVGFSPSMLSTVEIVGVLGYGQDDVPSWVHTSLMARTSTVVGSFELAALGGKVAERWLVGLSFQGDVGPIGLYGEGHVGFPDRDGDGRVDRLDEIHVRASAGMEILLVWHNVRIDLEYMFVSDGTAHPYLYPDRLDRLYPDDLPYMGRHYVGLTLGGEIIPILTLQTMALFNVTDYSGMASVFLVWNVLDELEVMAGLLAPWGEDPVHDSGPPSYDSRIESEFGLVPLMVFFESRFYF